jgi:hypothetical protein
MYGNPDIVDKALDTVDGRNPAPPRTAINSGINYDKL